MAHKRAPKKREKRGGIHWNAMGAGLLTASMVYPEQQALLLSMGSSSLIIGLLDRLKRNKTTATA